MLRSRRHLLAVERRMSRHHLRRRTRSPPIRLQMRIISSVGLHRDTPNMSGSKFFMNLDRSDWLDKKHTIFRKVTGDSIYNLVRLGEIETDKIRSLPTSVCEMRSLRSLDAHFNELRGLPLSFGRLTNLQTLNLANNFTDLTEPPDTFGDLTNLKELDLSNNQLHDLPVTFGRLYNLTKLNLDGNPLVFPPPNIVQQGVEAVKLCTAKRWLEILVEEERKNMLQVEEEAETGWLTQSTSWLTRSL